MTAAVCALCGFAYEPGGSACRERGCPLAAVGCRTLDCPRCGYAVPDERASVLARWVRRLFAGAASDGAPAQTLAELRPGETAVVERIDGDAALVARLTALGLVGGVRLHLVQRKPGYVVEIGATTLAFERRVAQAIRIGSNDPGPGVGVAAG